MGRLNLPDDGETARAADPMLRLAVLLLPQFTLSAFSLFLDPVRLASDDRDGSRQIHCKWRVMTLNGLPVRSSCGVEMYPTARGFQYTDIDWLVVVGGLTQTSIHDDDRVLGIISDAAGQGVRVIGLCTGVFSMAAAGILDTEPCCVSWFHRDEFVSRYDVADVDTTRLFRFGTRHVTCAGGIGAAHVSLEIIRRTFGDDAAAKCASIMLMPQYWTHDVEQPMAQLAAMRSTKVRDALRFMETRIDEPFKVPEVAAAASVSVRQLERLFRSHLELSPRKVMHFLRMKKASVYLRETDMPIIEVALACGFSSPSYFAATFKDAFGLAPSAYRRES